jgi:hypothetical protein
VLLGCQHIFGPAGGLPAPIAADALPGFVRSVALLDAFTGAPLTGTSQWLPIPGADAENPGRDLYAVALPEVHNCHEHWMRRDPAALGEEVMISAPHHADGPNEHRAVVTRVAGPVLILQFEDADLYPRGWSGAPVVDRRARLIGMLTRGGSGRGIALKTRVLRYHVRQAFDARDRAAGEE